jgi:Butirosin biosynthesis protein H, N-terminal
LNFTLYHNNHMNCSDLVILAMLKRRNVDVVTLRVQTGLSFVSLKDYSWKLSPYYKDILFEKNINYQVVNLSSGKEAIPIINEKLNSGFTVGINVDICELPYSMYYQRGHDLHKIEVIGIENDKAIVCDHYYQYYGQLELRILCKAIDSCRDFIDSNYSQVFYIDPERTDDFDTNQIILENIDVLEGKKLYNLKNFPENGFIGLEALPHIKMMILSLIKKDFDQKADIIENLFKDLQEVSFSRYNFHTFLKNVSKHELSEYIEEASQSWSVLANLLLKASLSGKYDEMVERIENRINRIIEIENQNLERLKISL